MAHQTLLERAGITPKPSALAESALVVIDAQEEYRSGSLPLEGINEAVAAIAALLTRARQIGMPVHHVVHQGSPGGLFDPNAPESAVIADVAQSMGESTTKKTLPNSFARTDLGELLDTHGVKKLILVGFMSHMCVDSTARAALDLGYSVTIPADCTATRPLTSPVTGETVPAAVLKEAGLAALSDRFATVVATAAEIPDQPETED